MNRSRKLPRPVVWLLRRSEPILGDLAEEYRTGDYSPMWLWKEALSALTARHPNAPQGF